MSAVQILIADDHELFRRSLRWLLESRPNWRVCGEAADGKEAVSQARELKPDLVLLDVSMPELNGLDAARVIRREVPSSKVLIISQNDQALLSRKAIEVGAYSFVSKANLARDLMPSIDAALAELKPKTNGKNGAHISPKPSQFVTKVSSDSETARLIQEMDWANTPVGPPEAWSPALRMMIDLLLVNRFPLLLWWGPQYVQFYNEAYKPIPGTKHPKSLGQPASECWSEIWHILQPLIDTPFNGGPSTWSEDLELEINRSNFYEETHFTVAYSPVPDNTVATGIGGVLATVHEVTDKVIGERRLALLRELAARAAECRSAEEACGSAAEILAKYPKDVPFALCYLLDENRMQAHLSASSGIDVNDPGVQMVVNFAASTGDGSWPFSTALHSNSMAVVKGIASRLPRLPRGPWSDPTNTAVIVPVPSSKPQEVRGLLVLGVSVRLALNDDYRTFFQLIAAQLSTAIANAEAYEEERKRAEALAEIDRAKTLFFSNVSHEFRTPLTLMLGPLEDALAAKDGLAAEHRESLEVAHRNSMRLLKLVNTLLDFSRIEAGRIQACYEPIDLASLTAELASVFRSATDRAGLQLVVDCPPLSEPVYVDREMWEKIVFNLLSNAFKFTFEGEIRISVRSANGEVELAVSDTGIGIPREDMQHLFERFYRVKGARGRSYEGSGIGLALVHELVKLHGGDVQVESEVDRGSTFRIRLPLGKNHLPPDRIGAQRTVSSTSFGGEAFAQECLRWLPGESDISDEVAVGLMTSAEPPTETQPSGQRSRILLADDNADMREYVRRLLSQNYDVITVQDGESALESVRSHPPDLILSDVMMPKLDGFGLLRAIRADERLKSIPVVLLSARAGEESRVEGLDAGADDYLVKPFSARELQARVRSQLTMASTRSAAAELQRKLLAETELERERLEELFLQVPAAICLLYGPEHRYSFVNPQYLKLTGRPQRECFIGKTVREALPEFEGQEYLNLLDRVYQTGVAHVGTESAVFLGGDQTPREAFHNFIYQPLRGASRSVEGILVHVVDVTEQVLARKKIEERERQFREIIDHLPAAIYTTDADGRLTHFNPAAVEFSGRTPELGTDRWCVSWKLYYPDGSPMPHNECPMAIALKEGRVIEGAEAIAECPDGTRRWFTPFPTPLRDRDGKIIGGINMLVDITERKEAERNNSLLASIVDCSDDVIISKNLDGTITSWNKAAERVFGYTAEEAIGKHIMLIVPPDRHKEEEGILRRLRKGERIEHFETVRQRKDGTTLDVSLTISPLRDSAGRVIGASKVARDITAQKRNEQALRQSEERFRKLSETLDAEVRTRTGELEKRNSDVLKQSELLRGLSRRLLQAQDEERRRIARELHDSAGQTLTVLGLTLARLEAQVPQDDPKVRSNAKEADQLVQQLHQEIRTMSYLLHPPLLDETGLGPALTWYVEGLRSRSRLEMTLSISEDLGRLPHDMELVIFRVIQESLTNIHRHSGSKVAEITVTREAETINVEIKDRGKGMSEQKLAEIKMRGSGVGIRGMQERVEQLRGQMAIESDDGGTRVLVTIPLLKSNLGLEPDQAEPLEAAV